MDVGFYLGERNPQFFRDFFVRQLGEMIKDERNPTVFGEESEGGFERRPLFRAIQVRVENIRRGKIGLFAVRFVGGVAHFGKETPTAAVALQMVETEADRDGLQPST